MSAAPKIPENKKGTPLPAQVWVKKTEVKYLNPNYKSKKSNPSATKKNYHPFNCGLINPATFELRNYWECARCQYFKMCKRCDGMSFREDGQPMNADKSKQNKERDKKKLDELEKQSRNSAAAPAASASAAYGSSASASSGSAAAAPVPFQEKSQTDDKKVYVSVTRIHKYPHCGTLKDFKEMSYRLVQDSNIPLCHCMNQDKRNLKEATPAQVKEAKKQDVQKCLSQPGKREEYNAKGREVYSVKKLDTEYMNKKRETGKKADAQPQRIQKKKDWAKANKPLIIGYMRASRIKHAEKRKASSKVYESTPQRKQSKKEYAAANRDKRRASSSKWYYANLVRAREISRLSAHAWRQTEVGKKWMKDYKNTIEYQLSVVMKSAADRKSSMTREDFKEIIEAPCFYCNEHVSTEGEIYYHGVDRIDSECGYEPGNCVPCCGMCNFMKGELNVYDFFQQCINVASNFKHFFTQLNSAWVATNENILVPVYGEPTTPVSLAEYKYRAKKHGIEFSISDELFYELLESDCYYCGRTSDPNHLNGIDRLDSNCGYTDANVEACCTACNYMKNSFDVNIFVWMSCVITTRWVKWMSDVEDMDDVSLIFTAKTEDVVFNSDFKQPKKPKNIVKKRKTDEDTKAEMNITSLINMNRTKRQKVEQEEPEPESDESESESESESDDPQSECDASESDSESDAEKSMLDTKSKLEDQLREINSALRKKNQEAAKKEKESRTTPMTEEEKARQKKEKGRMYEANRKPRPPRKDTRVGRVRQNKEKDREAQRKRRAAKKDK